MNIVNQGQFDEINQKWVIKLSGFNYIWNYSLIFFFQVEVAPCDSKGKEYTESDDKFVDSPGTKKLDSFA